MITARRVTIQPVVRRVGEASRLVEGARRPVVNLPGQTERSSPSFAAAAIVMGAAIIPIGEAVIAIEPAILAISEARERIAWVPASYPKYVAEAVSGLFAINCSVTAIKATS